MYHVTGICWAFRWSVPWWKDKEEAPTGQYALGAATAMAVEGANDLLIVGRDGEVLLDSDEEVG